MAQVRLRDGESQDELLKRVRKQVTKSGVLGDVRQKRWFISKGELRRARRQQARHNERR